MASLVVAKDDGGAEVESEKAKNRIQERVARGRSRYVRSRWCEKVMK